MSEHWSCTNDVLGERETERGRERETGYKMTCYSCVPWFVFNTGHMFEHCVTSQMRFVNHEVFCVCACVCVYTDR